jgi:hypothetical protein
MGITVWVLVVMFISMVVIVVYALRERAKLARQYLPFLLVIGLVVTPTLAQEDNDSIIIVENRPLAMDPRVQEPAGAILTSWIDEDFWRTGTVYQFLGNNSTDGLNFTPKMTVA